MIGSSQSGSQKLFSAGSLGLRAPFRPWWTWTSRNIEFVDYEALILRDRPFRASASVYVVDRAIFWGAGGWSHEIFQLDDVDLAAKLGFSGHAVLICSPCDVVLFYSLTVAAR
jgi:hypothetical protein